MLGQGDEIGKSVMRRQSQLESDRSTLDSHCQEIAELVVPMLGVFQQSSPQKGEKRTNKLMEGTAPHALMRYASAIEGFLTPRGERWSKLTTNNKDLNKIPAVKVYFEDINNMMFKVRLDQRAGFASQIYECLVGIGAFGTAGLFPNGQVRSAGANAPLVPTMTYTSIPLIQLFLSQNSAGFADTVHRRFKHTARNWIADFKGETPERIAKIADKEPDREFDLVHAVMPNMEYRPGSLGPKGMKYCSYYIDPEAGKTIRKGGYNTQRYAIARGTKAPGEVYGRSPSMLILPEIKTINEMRRGLLRAQHMTLNPPTLIHSESSSNFAMEPRSLNYGMVNAEGRPLAIPFQMGNTFPATEREMERIRELINDAYLLTLFQILVKGNSQETATMTLQKAKEQAIILAPLIGKLQTEFLGGIIESEIDILSEAGALPEMPPEMQEAQGEYSVQYQSDIQRALEVGEIEAYRNWFADAAPMAQINPDLLEVVDHEAILADAAEKRGISARFIRTPDQLAEIRAGKAQQSEAANAVPMAAQAAQIEQTRAQTDAIRHGGR
jgi:hypothetical protein